MFYCIYMVILTRTTSHHSIFDLFCFSACTPVSTHAYYITELVESYISALSRKGLETKNVCRQSTRRQYNAHFGRGKMS